MYTYEEYKRMKARLYAGLFFASKNDLIGGERGKNR